MFMMHTSLAFAHFVAGSDDLAWPLAEKACHEQPHYVAAIRVAAACNAAAGRRTEARRHVERALRLDPNLCISNLKDRVSTLRPDVLAKFVAALRKAGHHAFDVLTKPGSFAYKFGLRVRSGPPPTDRCASITQ